MDSVRSLAKGDSGSEDFVTDIAAGWLGLHGHMQEAAATSRQAIDFAQHASHGDRAALFETRFALREAFLGSPAEARRHATTAIALSNSREVRYGTAFAFALVGDNARAQATAEELAHQYPDDTSVRFFYLPSLYGQIALNQHDPSRALAALESATLYEFAAPRCSITVSFGALYSTFVRGQAYLALHQGDKAAAEFQKILSHPGVVVGDPFLALAQLQLARSLALSSSPQARPAYESFLQLWHSADPTLPLFLSARSELSHLP
jgi:eukaryotic-like serine/threonine-protein kinase